MSKLLRCIPALGAVFFASLALAACGGGIPSNAVVQVGGNPITKSTFEHWLSVAAASSATAAPGKTAPKPVVPDPPNFTNCIAHLEATAPKPAKGQAKPTSAQLKAQCQQQYQSLQQEVLGFLISSEWVIGEGSHLGVKISDQEVKKEFEKIKNQQFPKPAEFEKFLATSGQTVSDLLLRVKLNMMSSKIQQKIAKGKGAPTKAEIEKYYKQNQQRFGTPEKRNVAIILTKTEAAAKAAKKEIESGKSFASVAKSVSIDPTSKAKGGLLTGVAKGQEEAALNTAIFSAPLNKLSGPVKTPFGYYIYEVKSTTRGSQQTLAQAQASIKQQLTATQQQAALAKFVKEFKKTWTNKTECRAGYVVMDCKSYKAPKTPATTGTGTAVPQTTTPAQTTTAPATTAPSTTK
ncbi:MAG TPA: peptidyl-prolyl cis-trans isomerase [Solirubrobacteraceae bacterium]